jgi:hypothetical protein
MANRMLILLLAMLALVRPAVAQEKRWIRWIEGIWSDPPVTLVGALCAGHCSDVSLDALNALLDDPKNDSQPVQQLLQKAAARQDAYVRAHLTTQLLKNYPPDPADDPSFLNCEPYAGARQIFSRHQLQVTAIGRERLELRYGEWDVRRTIYMDGRKQPARYTPTRLGFSAGRWEGNTLVIETSGLAPGLGPDGILYSDQMRIVERYTRAEDGKVMWLTATLMDPKALREPIVLKKLWRWAPKSEIAPVVDCEKPTTARRRDGTIK